MTRYTIEYTDKRVEIVGDLSIEEAYDFINFFDKKGFKTLTTGEYSTIVLERDEITKKEEEKKRKILETEEGIFETLCNKAEIIIKEKEKKILDLEMLIKDLIKEEQLKRSKLIEENHKFQMKHAIENLENSDLYNEMTQFVAARYPNECDTFIPTEDLSPGFRKAIIDEFSKKTGEQNETSV